MKQKLHFWVYTQKKWKQGHVLSGGIHCQKVEAAQISINRWMDK